MQALGRQTKDVRLPLPQARPGIAQTMRPNIRFRSNLRFGPHCMWRVQALRSLRTMKRDDYQYFISL